MVKYAVNIQKGTTLQNDDIGKLQAGIAIPISDKQAKIAKYLRGVIVFDSIAGIKPEENFRKLYGIDEEHLNTTPMKIYQDFVKEFHDIKIAAEKWKEYQEQNKKR